MIKSPLENMKAIDPDTLEELQKTCPYAHVIVQCYKCECKWQLGDAKPCEHIDAMFTSLMNFGAMQYQIDLLKEMKAPDLHKKFDDIMKGKVERNKGKEPEIA